nr:collagen-like protein [Streptomyces sp. NBC_00998]
MSHRTTRTTRLKTATMVGAGVLAVALNVVPTTTAIADAIHRSGTTDSSVALPGPAGVVAGGDHGGKDGDHGKGRGPQGPQGKPGRPGHPGRPGVQGPQGFQGFQGAQGNQGFQGVPGTGSQGSQGNQGFQGEPGQQGNQGNQGSQGNQGFQGFQGFQGETGTVTTYVNEVTGTTTATATCNDDDLATGGGFQTANGTVRRSRPLGTPPNGWQATTTAAQPITAYVVCVASTP